MISTVTQRARGGCQLVPTSQDSARKGVELFNEAQQVPFIPFLLFIKVAVLQSLSQSLPSGFQVDFFVRLELLFDPGCDGAIVVPGYRPV